MARDRDDLYAIEQGAFAVSGRLSRLAEFPGLPFPARLSTLTAMPESFTDRPPHGIQETAVAAPLVTASGAAALARAQALARRAQPRR